MVPALAIAGRELGALPVERLEICREDAFEKAVVLHAWRADDFAEFDAGQGGTDDVLRGHAGKR